MSALNRRTGILLPALLLLATPLSAQIGNTSPVALGLSDNFTALARGVYAPAWNPAGLGMADNPGFSLTLLPLRGQMGLDPVTPADLADWGDTVVPASVREEWLTRIEENGGETGGFGVDVTELAFSLSRLAFSLSTSVRGQVNMAPAFAELFFFGNAGRTGDPQNYSFEGTTFDIAATSTAAASLGLPLEIKLGPLPDQRFAVGATLKYTVGHLFVTGADDGSTLSTDPLGVDLVFPIAVSDTAFEEPNRGSGIGLDVGASWSASIFEAGVTIHNLMNTFEWNIDELYFYQGTAVFNADTSYTEFEEALPFDQAPEHLKERVTDLYTFDPVLAAGAAVHVLPFLTVTGDIRHQLGESLHVGARNHVGVGAQLTIIPILPLRAGVSLISGGYQLGGGFGLNLGPIDLDLAGSVRDSELGAEAAAAIGLTIGM